jgi:hypothetical protein
VREFFGQTDIKTTQLYAHLAPDALHATARATAATAIVALKPVTNRTRHNPPAARNHSKRLCAPGGIRTWSSRFGKIGVVTRACENFRSEIA